MSLLTVSGGLLWFVMSRSSNGTPLCVQPGNASCYSTISAALNAARPGDTIRVAAGTYVEYVTITQTVTLQGGWNSNFTAHDPNVNVTTIRPPNASFSVVYIQGRFDNSAAVAPTLDGFTITGGGGGNHGGGLRITHSNAVITHNTIVHNTAYLLGGGIWVQGGAPLLQDNRIAYNQVTPSGSAYGGGVELEDTQATLINNFIAENVISNTTGYGGGVHVDGGGPVTLTNNTVLANTAAAIAGSAKDAGYGGGISVRAAPVTLNHNLIQGNTANATKSGTGGGVYIVQSVAFTLTANNILSNTAGYVTNFPVYLYGGGLRVDESRGHLADNTIAYNRANRSTSFGNGGGLAIMTSTISIQGGELLQNSTSLNCEGYGGGVYAKDSWITFDATRLEQNCASNTPYYGLGGGLAFLNTPYTLTNALIVKNRAYANDTSVGGVFADAKSPGLMANNTLAGNNGQGIRTGSPLTLTNNIIMGHTTGVSLTTAVPISATYNDFYNNAMQQRGFTPNVTNIVINPQLDASYHLLATSPLIDMGTRANAPDHDTDGEPRPMAGTSGLFRFDIGADEVTGPAQITRNLATHPADFALIGPGNPQDNPASDGSNDWIGNAVTGGDINGDGRADLIVGAQNLSSDFSGGTNDDGRVFSLYNTGARRLGVTDLFTTTADLEVRSWLHQQHIGQSFATHDIDGDGKSDLIIGAGGAAAFNITGTVYIFASGASLKGTRTLSPTMQATYRIRSDQNTGTFSGANTLAAGQLNGTGPADIVVGETNATVNGRDKAGAVYVFFGSNHFPGLWDLRSQPPSLAIYGPAANAELGRVAVADVNHDGKTDLVMRSSSTLYVLYGPLTGGTFDLAAQQPDLTLGGLSDGPLAAGDVNGDGKADVVAGDGAQVKLFSGNALTLLATFTGINAFALHVFDWNGDGKGDIVMGEPFRNRVFVVFGSAALAGTGQIEERGRSYHHR